MKIKPGTDRIAEYDGKDKLLGKTFYVPSRRAPHYVAHVWEGSVYDHATLKRGHVFFNHELAVIEGLRL